MLANLIFINLCYVSATETIADQEQTFLTIEEQIRAFAKSINKSNADDSAATALAKHGITGGGKKLSVGNTHALTSTLMNAELSLTTVIRGCIVGINKMQELNISSIFGDAGCYFSKNKLQSF